MAGGPRRRWRDRDSSTGARAAGTGVVNGEDRALVLASAAMTWGAAGGRWTHGRQAPPPLRRAGGVGRGNAPGPGPLHLLVRTAPALGGPPGGVRRRQVPGACGSSGCSPPGSGPCCRRPRAAASGGRPCAAASAGPGRWGTWSPAPGAGWMRRSPSGRRRWDWPAPPQRCRWLEDRGLRRRRVGMRRVTHGAGRANGWARRPAVLR